MHTPSFSRFGFMLSILLTSMIAPSCSSGGGDEPAGPVRDWEPPVPAQGGTCATNKKLCGDECVDPRDPDFGCGTCTPCAIPHAQAKCEAAGATYACSIAACDSGFSNCDKFPSDGCEADLASDAKNCGACGTSCPGSGTMIGVCKASACTTGCAAGTNLCGGVCVADSPTACGASCKACEVPANATATCASGACGFTCNAGFTKCASGCCSACGDTAGLQAGASWPTEGRCPTRIGRAVSKVPPTLGTKWTYAGGAASSPAIGADGTLYFASKASAVTALTSSGTLKWSTPVTGNGSAMPAIGADGTIYAPTFASSVGTLVALTSSGAKKWSVDVGSFPSAPVVSGKGTIYVGSGGKLFAITPSGTVSWSVTTGGAPRVALANDGTIYAAGSQLYAVTPTGTVKWSYPGGDMTGLGAAVVMPDDSVIVAIHNGSSSYTVNQIDASGTKKWSASSPLLFDMNLPVVSGTGRLFATGYITGAGHKVFEVSASGALPLSTPSTGLGAGNDMGNPVVDGADSLLVYTMSKTSTSTQYRLSVVATDGKATTAIVPALLTTQPSIGADGTVYVVGTDGALHALGS